MATYRQRGGVWRVEVCVNGIRRSATRDTKADAKAWAAKTETEIRNQVLGLGTDHTLNDALDRYATDVSPTHKGHKWELKRIELIRREFPRLCAMQMRKITTDDLVRWRDTRGQSVAAGSVLREISLLSSVFNVARKEWKWINSNPFADLTKPPQPQHRDRRISQDEIDRICLALGHTEATPQTAMQQVAIGFLFALETAMRSGEIRQMTWDRVNIAERYVLLTETKNGSRRKVPLSRRAIELLDLMRGLDKTRVFTVRDDSFVTLFRRARDRCEIEELRFHDTRHEALTRLAKKLPVLDLARMVGHKDPRSLMIYYNATPTEIAQLLD